MKPFRIIIHGQPATKKNSATLTMRGKGMKPIPTLLPSPAYRAYEKYCREELAKIQMQQKLPHFDGPVWVTAHYYLESRAHWPDLLGLEQATADILSDEYRIINHKRTLTRKWVFSDDRIIKYWDGSKIADVDRANPRVEITIIPLPLDAKTELDPKLRKQAAEEMQVGLF